ncbi:DDT domain-containing protein [Artemisia annua]|uniref:DDT domain-containing protein n=1 Tax=Artemisia annua TaxID=35608 RepID=A0A2U1PL06_ARTAN|nr:DDT domain-containing protein [Artemisia annua]
MLPTKKESKTCQLNNLKSKMIDLNLVLKPQSPFAGKANVYCEGTNWFEACVLALKYEAIESEIPESLFESSSMNYDSILDSNELKCHPFVSHNMDMYLKKISICNLHTNLWHIEYLNRSNLHRQRVWTCKNIGKSNLTYEEALVSGKKANEKVHHFSKELMEPVLPDVHSVMTLSTLCLYCRVCSNTYKAIHIMEFHIWLILFIGKELVGFWFSDWAFTTCKYLNGCTKSKMPLMEHIFVGPSPKLQKHGLGKCCCM